MSTSPAVEQNISCCEETCHDANYFDAEDSSKYIMTGKIPKAHKIS